MVRVDFYLLSDANEQARKLLACRLCEKAYQKLHQIYMLVSHPEEAKVLDDLLWTFRDDSFLPHHIASENISAPAPIQIVTTKPSAKPDVLINLTTSIPDFFADCQRIIEIVSANEKERATARENFRLYRQRGCQLESHQV